MRLSRLSLSLTLSFKWKATLSCFVFCSTNLNVLLHVYLHFYCSVRLRRLPASPARIEKEEVQHQLANFLTTTKLRVVVVIFVVFRNMKSANKISFTDFRFSPSEQIELVKRLGQWVKSSAKARRHD